MSAKSHYLPHRIPWPAYCKWVFSLPPGLNASVQQRTKWLAKLIPIPGMGKITATTSLRFSIVNPAISTVVSGSRAYTKCQGEMVATGTLPLTNGKPALITGTLPTNVCKHSGPNHYYRIYIYE